MSLYFVAAAALLARGTAVFAHDLPFKAAFGSSPQPFRIDVDKAFIESTRQKVLLSRYPTEFLDVPQFQDGPPVHNASAIADHWVNHFDWNAIQSDLNAKYRMFTTTIPPSPKTNYPHEIPLHFVHHRSARPDATPFLFMHGWPGSFLEVGGLLDSLTSPPNASLPAFHVVAPSNPGTGFSPAPIEHSAIGPFTLAHTYASLMSRLGYDKFVIQAGDSGAILLRMLASSYPDRVIAALANFWLTPPTDDDRKAIADGTASADEVMYVNNHDFYAHNASGYRLIHETLPLQLAYALTDSPIGWTMWIYSIMNGAVSTQFWTLDQIITWSMMYYVQGPYTGMRFYKLLWWDGIWEKDAMTWGLPKSMMDIKVPVGLSQFPKDVWYGLPLEWAQRAGNVVARYVHDTGGHFPSTEVPDLLLQDIWSFFRDRLDRLGNASSGVVNGVPSF